MVWKSHHAYKTRVGGREEPACVEARGGGWEEKTSARGQGQWPGGATHFQGVVAALVQEGLEELFHFECQEGWW